MPLPIAPVHYTPDAQAIADEIRAAYGEPDGPDHPLAAGFDVEFANQFVNRAFARAGFAMPFPSGFLRSLNSGAFETLLKGKEIETRFHSIGCDLRGWWLEISDGETVMEVLRGDVWLLLRLAVRPIDRARARLRQPGADQISDRKLAAELGVSRDTVARARKPPNV